VPVRHGRIRIASVGVPPPNPFFRSFPFFAFVMPGLDPGIHAEASLAQCCPPARVGVTSAWTTGIGGRRTPFCERLCPAVTSQRVA
jgi:hypothetical protein